MFKFFLYWAFGDICCSSRSLFECVQVRWKCVQFIFISTLLKTDHFFSRRNICLLDTSVADFLPRNAFFIDTVHLIFEALRHICNTIYRRIFLLLLQWQNTHFCLTSKKLFKIMFHIKPRLLNGGSEVLRTQLHLSTLINDTQHNLQVIYGIWQHLLSSNRPKLRSFI